MKKIILALTVLTTANLSTLSAAGFTFYTNQSAFLSALAGRPAYTNNFTTIPTGGSRLDTNVVAFSGGAFSYTATIPGVAPTTSFWGDTFGVVNALSTGDPINDVFVMTNFSLNTAAFGGYFFPSDGIGVVSGGSVTLTTVFADLSSTNITTGRGSANLNDWFFGWITDEPGTAVRSVTLTAGNDYASSANVTLAVPEPSTYALLGLAAAGLAGYMIRRRAS